GRIRTEDAEQWYVGRRHVEDERSRPVVVDWRAPVAAAFYRATAVDPCGLTHRRRFVVEDRRIVALLDEALDDPDSPAAGGLPDPLLAELERSRTGQMRDIVATIAAEQDEIIRAPLAELLVVQGGPGTGKTAVGLHRAAFLLFEHRTRLIDRRVLVVGPNPVFLRYIADVLPSLGETAVTQTTVAGLLAARFRVRATDTDDVTRLKGSPVMAEVVRAAVWARIRPLAGGLELRSGIYTVRLTEDDLEQLQKTVQARRLPANQGRDVFRNLVLQEAWRRHSVRPGVDPGSEPIFTGGLRADSRFKAALDKMWPTLSPAAVVAGLLGSPKRLREAAAGLLSPAEQKLLRRKAAPKVDDTSWTAADLPLLDEAQHLCAGVPATYGHVVVDEAQDLSPLALRMLARRAEGGSMTVLGDLAQATAVDAAGSWDAALDALTATMGEAARVRRTELTVGYRVPAAILDVANRLLPEAAPEVTPARSVRPGGDPPFVLVVAEDDVASTVASEIAALRQRVTSVAVVAADHRLGELSAALAGAGTPAGTVGPSGLPGGDAVAVLGPATAKGLEFDAVVVVEPAEIAALDNGLRHLYVAMTRAVQHLGVVHTRPLPDALRLEPPGVRSPGRIERRSGS
ncbi:MAG: AAA family ATPase, partial [Acidimicrobiia bacterium]|nr:AAA family ATPase [Acidimicrobiia bacterium]